MKIDEFIAKYYPCGFYPNGEPLPGRREELNRRNSQWLCTNTPIDLVFVGDSITEWWELPVYFSRYGVVVNRGVANERTGELTQRFEQDALDLCPKAIVFAEGVNDINDVYMMALKTGVELNHTAVEAALETICDHYRSMFSKAAERKIPMIICSVLPIGCMDGRNQLILRINEKLKTLCAQFGYEYADTYNNVVSEDGLTMQMLHFGDDLHPHVLGYNAMANALYPHLDKIFKE